MTVTMVVQLRGHLRWRDALPLCAAVVVGTVVGGALFIRVPEPVIRRIVGGALILASIMGLLRPGMLHFLRRRIWAWPPGFLSG